jgi:hypothetical protein
MPTLGDESRFLQGGGFVLVRITSVRIARGPRF